MKKTYKFILFILSFMQSKITLANEELSNFKSHITPLETEINSLKVTISDLENHPVFAEKIAVDQKFADVKLQEEKLKSQLKKVSSEESILKEKLQEKTKIDVLATAEKSDLGKTRPPNLTLYKTLNL